jgi:hypothetical protein
VPFDVTIDHEKKRVTAVAHGGITADDMGKYIAERVRQGAYSYTQLIDMRNATMDLAADETPFGVAMEKRRESRAGAIPRTAIVALQGTASYGFARQLAMQLEFGSAQVEVFAELSEAESWLSTTPERV